MNDHSDITLVMDNETNDDWIRSLPGYKNETAIIDKAIAELTALGGRSALRKKLAASLKKEMTGKTKK